jgi:hypothetical protein
MVLLLLLLQVNFHVAGAREARREFFWGLWVQVCVAGAACCARTAVCVCVCVCVRVCQRL